MLRAAGIGLLAVARGVDVGASGEQEAVGQPDRLGSNLLLVTFYIRHHERDPATFCDRPGVALAEIVRGKEPFSHGHVGRTGADEYPRTAHPVTCSTPI